jgi:hypothetical protein
MTMRKKSSAADKLKRSIVNTAAQAKPAAAVEDEFAQAVARQLEAKNIAQVPGLPKSEPEPEWFDRVIKLGQRHDELEAKWEAQRQADAEELENPPQSTASVILSEITKANSSSGSGHMALNSAGILRAALGGGPGSINNNAANE